METIQLDDFLSDGIIKEEEFRNQVKTINWESFRDKQVMIKGCASVPVPTWAYLIIAHVGTGTLAQPLIITCLFLNDSQSIVFT